MYGLVKELIWKLDITRIEMLKAIRIEGENLKH